MSESKQKIAIITSSLGGGGAQKSAANLSFVLSNLNYEVHLISILNQIDYEFKGHLLNLGLLKDKDDSFLGRIKRFWIFRNYLKLENFEFVIDSRARPTFLKQLFINNVLYYKQNVVFVVHSFFLKNYFPTHVFLAKILYSKSKKFVGVSEDISALVQSKYGFFTTTVYNAVIPTCSVSSATSVELPLKYILYFGRINDKVKNLSLLLEAYQRSNLMENDTHLVILGNGPDVLALKTKTQHFGISNFVWFIPYIIDPSTIIKKAIFSTLTSVHEGFPMVLIESLSHGVPVVSVDCKSGPKEVVNHRENGLLVENHCPKALSEAFNLMIEDLILYNHCKEQAKKSVEKFSIEKISKKWKDFLSLRSD